MLTWPRLRIVGVIAQAAVCCLALAGCKIAPPAGHGLNTTVADTTSDPLTSLGALKKLAGTQEELANLLEAYQNLWTQNTETATKLAAAQGAEDRANAAQAAEDQRKAANGKRMFWCGIAAGCAGLAAFALPIFGVVGIPRIGGSLLLVGAALVAAPSLIDVAAPAVQIGSYGAVALLLGGGVIQMRANWIAAKAARVDAAALNPDDPLTQREAIAVKRELNPAYNKAFSLEKQKADERAAMELLKQQREVATP